MNPCYAAPDLDECELEEDWWDEDDDEEWFVKERKDTEEC
jgi:hypothetical protein